MTICTEIYSEKMVKNKNEKLSFPSVFINSYF